jgi:4-amino-4-deoxy-L-arabinose transferase-like glycosyltransferase
MAHKIKIAVSDKLLISILYFLIFLFSLTTLFYSYNRAFCINEFEAMHTAWHIYSGKQIYVDFFQHHHPLWYYILSWILYFTGESTHALMYARLLIFFQVMVLFMIIYGIGCKIFNRTVALIAVLLLMTILMFLCNIIEIHTDTSQLLFAFLSFLLLLNYFERKKLVFLLLSAFSISISFLILQKAIFFGAFNALFLLWYVYVKQMRLSHLIIYGITALIPIAFYLGYLVFIGFFQEYLILNWLINASIPRFYPFDFFRETFKTNMLQWFFYILGLLFFLNNSYARWLGIYSMGFLGSLFIMKHPWPNYFLPAFPFIALIAAHTMYELFRHNRLMLLTVLLLSTIPSWFGVVRGSLQSNKEQLAKVNYILSETSKSDCVYDWMNRFNLFRNDIDYFWFSSVCLEVYKNLTDYHYDLYSLIDQKKPKIINSECIQNCSDYRIKHYYKVSPRYPDILIRVGG